MTALDDDVDEEVEVEDEDAGQVDELSDEQVDEHRGETVVEPDVDQPHPFDQDAVDDRADTGVLQVELDEDDVEATDEHADLVPPVVPDARVSRRAHRREMKASARRVRRVVRHVDPWSVFKIASIFIICVWGIVVLASLLIWRAADSAGTVDNTEEFVKDIGFKDFDFDPQKMFEALLSAGAVLAVSAIFFIVLLTFLFNLICDMTGGLRVTMIEQDLADARKRRGRKAKADTPSEG